MSEIERGDREERVETDRDRDRDRRGRRQRQPNSETTNDSERETKQRCRQTFTGTRALIGARLSSSKTPEKSHRQMLGRRLSVLSALRLCNLRPATCDLQPPNSLTSSTSFFPAGLDAAEPLVLPSSLARAPLHSSSIAPPSRLVARPSCPLRSPLHLQKGASFASPGLHYRHLTKRCALRFAGRRSSQ